jgi:hypothetical protein
MSEINMYLLLLPRFMQNGALPPFRRIYGPKYEDGEWEIRTNRELEEFSKEGNIVKWIKGQINMLAESPGENGGG